VVVEDGVSFEAKAFEVNVGGEGVSMMDGEPGEMAAGEAVDAGCGVVPGCVFFICIEIKFNDGGFGVGLGIDADLGVGVSFGGPMCDEDGLLNDGVDGDVNFQGFIGEGDVEGLKFVGSKCGGGLEDFVGQFCMECLVGLFECGELVVGDEGDVGRGFGDEVFRTLV